MELITKTGTPITSVVGAKNYCRIHGLDAENLILNEETKTYSYIEKEDKLPTAEITHNVTLSKKGKISIEELIKRAEDEGYEVPTFEEVEDAIEDGVKFNERTKRDLADKLDTNPLSAEQTMDLIKRLDKQPKVLMTITPVINAVKNCLEDKTRQLEYKGKPQVDVNNRPIMVAYVEACINGITFTYNITDPYRRVIPFQAPLDVAKILADAYYPKQCSGFLMPDGNYYTPHQVGANQLPIYASEADFKQVFTPAQGQRVFQNR